MSLAARASSFERDRLLRREAGEGWHPGGPIPEVLRVVTFREAVLEDMDREVKEAGLPHGSFGSLYPGHALLHDRVNEVKTSAGLPLDPPPRPPEG